MQLTQNFKMAAKNSVDFWKTMPDDYNNLGIKNFVKITILHHFRDKHAFVFYAEIQDGCQKLWENIFLQKLADDCVYSGGIEIALSDRVSKINAFLCFTQKFKMVRKTIVGQNCQMTRDTQGLKIFVEMALSHTAYETRFFYCQEKLCHLVNR